VKLPALFEKARGVMKMLSNEVFPSASLLIETEISRGIYLLIGNSGVGKTSFCKTFSARRLPNQENGIYLHVQRTRLAGKRDVCLMISEKEKPCLVSYSALNAEIQGLVKRGDRMLIWFL
jgi:ABC-type molybdate transport system ATPase subunit